jgi:drug/metabolite transporter (DMT)-like permease
MQKGWSATRVPFSPFHERGGAPSRPGQGVYLGSMGLPSDPIRPLLALNTKVVLLALTVAALTAAGVFFQKINGVRVGNVFLSGWILLATICFFPTFLITNKVFLMGGRVSVFIPLTAATYVFSMLIGRFYFRETVSSARWVGCALIIAGVAAIARG